MGPERVAGRGAADVAGPALVAGLTDRRTRAPVAITAALGLLWTLVPTDASFIHEDSLFRDYYRVFDDRMKRYRVQPFFNDVETPAERAEFVRDLGVTHVLVSPVHYDELRSVLDALPEQFTLKYDNARWAVYEASRKAS